MQKQQLLQLQADLTRKKELKNILIYTLKSGRISMNEMQALKKAVDTFAVSISQLQGALDNELKKEGN